MICTKCKMEYREGFTKCSDCGEALVENETIKQSDGRNWFFKFGETTAIKAISLLFFLSLLPLLYNAILFGKYLYLTNTYIKSIEVMLQSGMKSYQGEQVNNLPLGILGGIVFFIIEVLVWKVLCELLIIIFRAIETYTQKNKIL